MNSTENTECGLTGNMLPENDVKHGNDTTKINEKECFTCKKTKPTCDFNRHKQQKDGLSPYCKECYHKWYSVFYRKNKKKILSKHRIYYKKHGVKWKSTRSKYQMSHREESKKYTQKYRDRYRDIINKKVMTRYYNEPAFRLKKTIPSLIRKSLRGSKNNHHWENLVGYSLEKLKLHLESKFVDNMKWENYGEWHIDHIKPISSFQIIDPWCEEFKQCWALSNLRPLWAFDNLSKGSKIL